MKQIKHPNLATITIVLMAALIHAAGAQLPSARSSKSKERLVPGNYGDLSDSQGNRWNIQQSGYVGRGTNSLLNSCAQLHINNAQFYNHQNPMMTADQKEYVIENGNPQQFQGLKVSRRIRVMEKEGCLRFLEIFENPTAQAVAINVEIRHQLGTKYKEYYSDAGAKNVGSLGKKESGIYVIPSSTATSYKPVAFTMSSPNSKDKPRFAQQNQYSLHFYYMLQVPAGQTSVILHTIAQPGVTKDFGAKNLGKMMKGSSLKSVLKSVPSQFRSRIVNFSSGGDFGGLSLLSSTTIDGLGIDRGKSDVLAFGPDSRMLGSSSCGELKLATSYGDALIPFEQVAAFVGGDHGRRRVSRVFLRDGQVYTGEASADGLRFVMPNGTKMELNVASLDRLVRKESPAEGKWGETVNAMLETYSGDRIAISNGAEVMLDAVTPWGPIRFSLDDVLWLSPPEEEPVGHHIEFKDGSRFFAYLVGAKLSVDSELFGKLEIETGQIRAIVTAGMLAKVKDQEKAGATMMIGLDDSLQVPHLNLVGGQRIIGRVASPTIGAITNAQLLEILPENIRLMRSMREEFEGAPGQLAPFVIELWGGSLISGQIKEAIIPVMVREQAWNIPLEDVVDIVSPTPRISDETRQTIAGLIRQLGDDDWKKRQAASDALGEFGYMAKALLVEALKVNADAEARRRIDQLLNEMP